MPIQGIENIPSMIELSICKRRHGHMVKVVGTAILALVLCHGDKILSLQTIVILAVSVKAIL